MHKNASIPFILLLLFLTIVFSPLSGQNRKPVMPVSTYFPELLLQAELIQLISPDVSLLLNEDKLSESNGGPYRMGVSIPVHIDCAKTGSWKDIPGGKLWIVKIHSPGAAGLGLYFNKFLLPEGCTVHVFDSEVTQVLGTFTHISNPAGGFYASGVTPGNELIIECFIPDNVAVPDINIDEVLYVYRSAGMPQVNSTRDFGGADSCEVNINCEEGQAWQDAKHGVLRILVKSGGSTFWCTGSLINTTRNDFTPYFITADHCARRYGGAPASPSDLMQWIFYFNFESADCSNPLVQPALYSSVGAIKLASASSDSGSDFFLAMLNHKIPGSYKPFFNGWDRSGLAANSGACIHQPEGDIKKISTFNTTLVSSQWGTTSGTHWMVKWSATVNGNGITEPGSSGSPLFDAAGHIVGSLTGGNSSCTSLLDPDYYGKFAYSWESNGGADSLKLRPWLDPDNTGVLDVRGLYDTIRIRADFNADNLIIPVGSTVNFTDRTSGRASTLWNWSFEGADPATSSQQSPAGIVYSRLGSFDVQLIASNGFDGDTMIRKNYIHVIPVCYPNPSSGIVHLLSGNSVASGNPVKIYNRLGQVVYETIWPSSAGNDFSIDLSLFGGNIFFISFSTSQGTTTEKVVLITKQ
jgi:PKD repeat protein